MTTIVRDGLTWVAAKDGLGHARGERGTALRTLCGAVPTPTRYAWPIRDWCAVCWALAEGLAAAAKAERKRQRGAA